VCPVAAELDRDRFCIYIFFFVSVAAVVVVVVVVVVVASPLGKAKNKKIRKTEFFEYHS